jgi:hypothetical protein
LFVSEADLILPGKRAGWLLHRTPNQHDFRAISRQNG